MKLHNYYAARVLTRILYGLGMVVLLVPCAAEAALVTLTISGTYDTAGQTVFGLSGPAVPYSYQITYDTDLDTNTFFFPAGAPLGGLTTTHDWYGYSASGITDTELTFGTHFWTVGDLLPRPVAPGVVADLWFDTDISVSTPTRSAVFFSDLSGSLALGGAGRTGNIFLQQTSGVIDDFSPGRGFGSMTIERSIAVVPEPTTLTLMGLALLALSGRKLARWNAGEQQR